MRALGVVMVSPVSDFLAGMLQGFKPMQLEAFIPELAVETLHEGILDGLAWFYEPQTNTGAFITYP